MKAVNVIAYLSIFLPVSTLSALTTAGGNLSGRMNAWSLYETNDVDATTVALVYDATNKFLGVAVGRDIARECAITGRHCTYRKLGGDGAEYEITLDRETDAGTSAIGNIGGDSMLANLGIDTKFEKGDVLAKVSGNFTARMLESRALYGSQRYRPKFSDTFVQYKRERYQMSAGRKTVTGGVIVDGLTADYFFGPDGNRDSKSIGFFAGLAPDPLSKYPGTDEITFGPTFRFIPEFSNNTDTKLAVESSLVADFYNRPNEGYQPNRFYLYTRAHFTPVKTFSVLGLSTLDLPGVGETDDGFKSTHLSIQTFWRPQPEWFASVAFSQFRIDRFMEPEAVRWVTDSSAQSLRVSDSLDHSQRYRFDIRASYRPFHMFQPYIRVRYERRTFDTNKTSANAALTDATPASTDLSLLGRKDAYRGTAGVRLFFIDDQFETDSSATYNQRYQSKGWDLYQSFAWESNANWNADTYVQWVSSERNVQNSAQGAAGVIEQAKDFYAGVGGSYRFLSDFLGQIRYDFSSEEDAAFDRRITTHTILGRIDYSF
jgi:hypothetical protein